MATTACPEGWHLPTEEKWKTLEKSLGMSQSEADITGNRITGNVGGKLKEEGEAHWYHANLGATNSTGFTALGAGDRGFGGGFSGLMEEGRFWNVTTGTTYTAGVSKVASDGSGAWRQLNFDNASGMSVRCVRN